MVSCYVFLRGADRFFPEEAQQICQTQRGGQGESGPTRAGPSGRARVPGPAEGPGNGGHLDHSLSPCWGRRAWGQCLCGGVGVPRAEVLVPGARVCGCCECQGVRGGRATWHAHHSLNSHAPAHPPLPPLFPTTYALYRHLCLLFNTSILHKTHLSYLAQHTHAHVTLDGLRSSAAPFFL